MKKPLGKTLVLVGAITLLHPLAGFGQDFFRNLGTSRSSGGMGPVVPSDYTYDDGSPSGLRALRPGQEMTSVDQLAEEDKYNFALGPLRFSLAAGVGVEWNDNIFLSQDNRESDIIIRPSLDLDARWHLSELNTLRFNLGVSYAKYLDHSDQDTDGVLISPNSELALTFFVGTVKFTVRDRFSYQEDTYSVAQLTSVARYPRYENQAGIMADWQVNQQFNVQAGYDHYNLWTTGSDFNEQDRAIDTIFIRPGVQLTPALKVGVSAAYSFIDFDDSNRADGDNLLAGMFAEIQFSEHTNLYVEAGYQSLKYDGNSSFDSSLDGLVGVPLNDFTDEEDSTNWYAKFELQNKPSEYFRHRISGSKTAEIGFGTNFYDLYHLEYDAEWKITEKVSVGPSLFYEYYTASGEGGEKAHRYGATLGIRYYLSDSLTLGLDYRYILKDSNIEDADFYQNLVFLSAYYKF